VATENSPAFTATDANAALIARAEAAVSRLLDDVIVEAEPIARGFAHDNVRVVPASGREAVVKFPYWPRPDKFARIQMMFERLRAAGVGCPDVLAADITGESGEPCLILSWLPGETLSDAWPTLTEDEQQAAGRDLGEWTARLHAIRFPDVGQGDLLQRDLERRLGLAREAGLIPERLLDSARAIIEPVAASRLTEPAAAIHADLYLDNVIIAGDPGSRRMAGVIDFDRLMPEDPAREFVKFRWWVFERYPELIEPLLTGYLRAGGDPDAASPVSRRAHALALLESIGGIVYFTARADTAHGDANDSVMADDMRRRFSLLIGGEIPLAS
jgi:aminoglycoside phosphotransferase (APT) family kinase protein